MYYHSIEAKNIEQTVKAILKTYLNGQLTTEPYLTDFSSYGGVDIIFKDEEATKDESAGRPFIRLSKDSCETFRWGKTINNTYYFGSRCEWTFEAEVVANSFSGAETGAANPVASDTKLSDALFTLIDSPDNYNALAALGLEEAKIEVRSEEVDGDESNTRSNGYTITFTTFILPTYSP
jgi:hypothetical protein